MRLGAFSGIEVGQPLCRTGSACAEYVAFGRVHAKRILFRELMSAFAVRLGPVVRAAIHCEIPNSTLFFSARPTVSAVHSRREPVRVGLIVGMASRAMRFLRMMKPGATAPQILAMRYWLKMIRIYARANSAEVVEFKSGWYRTIETLPVPAVRAKTFSIAADSGIAVRRNRPGPEPAAGVGFRAYVLLEALDLVHGQRIQR